MNKIEEIVYRAVSGNPSLKNFIRNSYQKMWDLLPKSKEILPDDMTFVEGCFFGFHDISSVSPDDTKLLVIKPDFDLRMPKPLETAAIGYYEINETGIVGQFHKIDDTGAWNWHKGSRQQWLNDDIVVYNTCVNNRAVSKLIDINTGKFRLYEYPIDTISPNGEVATTFSYERLQLCMPGYGYPYIDEGFLDHESPNETGLFIMDMKSGVRNLLVPLEELVRSLPEEFQIGYTHFVTHSEFSHDSKYISFMHRWTRPKGNILSRKERLMVYNIESGKLIELPSELNASHYSWNNRHQIIASVILGGKCCHALYDINNPTFFKKIAANIINSDGHQTFINNEEFITDTYPNRRRDVFLYRINCKTQEVQRLARMYSPGEFQTKDNQCHIACDLHPRLSKSKKYLTFDSPRTGQRGVYLVKIG